MSDSKFLEKEIVQNNKKNFLKSILVGISLISISFFIYICLSIKKTNIKQLKLLSETQEKIKIKISPYVSPNRVEGILDNLFFPYHSDIIRTVDEYEFL